jgi:YVTN family beta-propeller protein
VPERPALLARRQRPHLLLVYTTSLTGVSQLIEIDVTDVLDDLPPTVEDAPIIFEISSTPDAAGRYLAEQVIDRGSGTRNQGTGRPEQPKPPAKEDQQPSNTAGTPGPVEPLVQWAAASQRVAEGVVVQVAVQLSAPTTEAVTAPFSTGGTATPGTAYTTGRAAPGPLVIPPGATNASVSVSVSADGVPELDETILLTLGTPTNGTLGATTVHTITVTGAGEDPPAVLTIAPIDGATGIGSQANVTVTFTEPVTVSGAWFQLVCDASGTRTPANSAVGGGPATFTIDPNADFTPGEQCTLTIFATLVSDQDALDPPDTLAADVTATFTIDAAPTVTATAPTNGATGIATNAGITVTISEPVDVTTGSFDITCAPGGVQSFTVAGSGTTTVTLEPAADLPAGSTCTVTVVAARVADVNPGDPPDTIAGPNPTFSFTTDAAPTVTSTTPADSATNVSLTDTLTVQFSEPVTATTASFTLTCGGPSLPYALSASPATTFTLDPSSPLPGNATCTLTVVANQVTDTDAADPPNEMAAKVVRTFTTAIGPRAYVTNLLSNTVSVVDLTANSVVDTIPVGVVPLGVAALPDGSRVYVANFASNSVSVIGSATNTVVTTIPVGNGPHGIVIMP